MHVLWKKAEASVSEVRAALPRPLAYTTVMTILDRMAAKGLASRRKSGRAWLYSANLEPESARRQAVERLLAEYFDHDATALLQFLRSSRADTRVKPPARQKASAARGPSIDDTLL